MDSIIKVNNVQKTFGKNETLTNVLNGVNFEVQKGEFISLMGASGSGKSTMLYLLGGLDREYQGDIEICGENLTGLKEKKMSDIRLNKIGFIFQFYNLVQNLSVEDNIMLPIQMSHKDSSEYRKKLADILAVTGLSDKRKAKPAELSGGQQQRVAVARAILNDPEILLADEPTGNLDSKAGSEIMDLFEKINKEKGITILLVTHSQKCSNYAGRTILLANGQVVE